MEGSKKLKNSLSIHDFRTDRDFGTVHALVVLNNSTLLFKQDVNKVIKWNNRYGIFVDILPLDQFPENEELKNKQIKDLARIRKIRYFYQGAIEQRDSAVERFSKKVLQRVLKCFFSMYKLNLWQQQIVQRYDTNDEGRIWCSMLSHYSIEKLTMPKAFFGVPRLMDFSGRNYYVPERVEDYLKQLFGDYMLIPSNEKRMEQIDSVYYASWINENGEKIEIKNQSN